MEPNAEGRLCTLCHLPMERGYVMGRVADAARQEMYPANVAWLPATVGPRGRGMTDQQDAEPLGDLQAFGVVWAKRPRFPGWRCAKCKWVEFSYADAGRIG